MAAAPKTLIFDNGAHSIKAGYLEDADAKNFPNAIFKTKSDRKRVFVSDELDDCPDRSSMFHVLPFQSGYLVNWDTQLQIWNRLFGKDHFAVDFQETRLLMTDPNEIARAFTDNTEEIIFENFRFHSLLKTSAPFCVGQAHCTDENPCCIVVDSGHSFTHIVPLVKGKIVREGVIRIDMGGRRLTNQLKDWISYRQFDVKDETYVVNCCKEDVCFVSTNFQQDLNSWREKRLDYILPDFMHLMRGQILERGVAGDKKPEFQDVQHLTLGVERFALPELLFHPGHIEIDQMGVVEALHTSISRLPREIQLLAAKNVVLVGGNSHFPGYRQRIELDLRGMLDDQFQKQIFLPVNPVSHAWCCAKSGLEKGQFGQKFLTRFDYEERGVVRR